jgi:hypothetical protein
MTLRIVVGRSVAIIGVAAGAYGVARYHKLSTVDSSHITTLKTASDSFVNSQTIREVVNP